MRNKRRQVPEGVSLQYKTPQVRRKDTTMLLKLQYTVSKDFMNSTYLKNGKLFNGGKSKAEIPVDAESLSLEQRQLVLAISPRIDWSQNSVTLYLPGVPYDVQSDGSSLWVGPAKEVESELTVEGWFATAKAVMEEVSGWETKRLGVRKAYLQKMIDKRTAELTDYYDKRYPRALEMGTPIHEERLEAAKSLGCDFTQYEKILADLERMIPVFKAEFDARQLEADVKKLRAEAEERAERAKADKEKSEWIDRHGSHHLKTAFGRGHDCQRLYVDERAADELGGFGKFVIDYAEHAEWSDRSCPSVNALSLALAIEEKLKLSAQIVWLTSEPRRTKKDYESYRGESEQEVIVVENYLNRYRVVFVF